MMPEKDNPALPALSAPPVHRRRASRSGLGLFVALVLFGLLGWQWFDTRQKMAELQQQVSQKLADIDTASKEGDGARKQTAEQIESLQARLGALDSRLSEFQGQSTTLQTLYQDIDRSREEVTLLEIEQAITLAGQQLQLAGNVPVAVLALQAADARLARLDRPQHLPLRKALAKDLARLNALPFVDLAGLSLRLEELLLAVDKLPLKAYGRPEKSPEIEKPAAAQTWWQRTGGDIWQEIKGLIRIQRFDRDDPALLAPGQDFVLRENLKLRLLNARLALFSRDQSTYRNELKVVADWLARHFDGNDKAVQTAQATLRQMTASGITVELPNLNDSQAALRSLRPGKEKR
jgi:uroporphyrin-III C-methyltransferase